MLYIIYIYIQFAEMKAAESTRVKSYYRKVSDMNAAEHDALRGKVNQGMYDERQRIAGIIAARSGEE